MTQRTLDRLRLYAILVVITVFIGLIQAYLFDRPGSPEMSPLAFYSHTGFSWTLGGVLGWGFKLFFMPGRFGAAIRRLHFTASIVVQALVLTGIVMFAGLTERLVLHGYFDIALFAEPAFYRIVGTVFLLVAGLYTATQIVRITGGRVLVNFILGRYHQPVREERIFMFLDLAGSTALAERLGDIGVQTLLTRFFFDISEPIVQFGGEIHRYVGDQVVVTWPLRKGDAVLRAIGCYFAIVERMKEEEGEYRRKFDAAPAFRAGLHGGPVVVSECGDSKQEIVYFGDTVNTAARIEQQCKVLDCPVLISADLLKKADLPEALRAESKGTFQLRGHKHETELFSLEQVGRGGEG